MPSVSTSGWDVVNVSDIDTLNKVASEDHIYPDKFEETYTLMGRKLKIDGQWGEWRIANEASGKNVYMHCTIQNGSLSFPNSRATMLAESYPLNSNEELSSITIQISLAGLEALPEKWLSQDDESSSITEKTQCFELIINYQDPIVITQANFTNKELYCEDVGLAMPIEMTFKRWFNNNIDQFKKIFAVILIGLRANKGDYQWLKPSAYSYSANSSIDEKTAAFGALTLIDGKTEIGHLQQTVDIAALQLVKPLGANAALIVSKAMFVKHILLPAAICIVKSSTEADFDISESGLSLTNNREMVWQDFDGPNDEKMSPMLPKESFNLTLQSDYIHISIVGAHYRPRPGMTLYMNLEQNFKYKVEKNEQGEPVFVPDEQGLGDATLNCTAVLDDWMKWLELVMSVITLVASVLALGTSFIGGIAKAARDTVVGVEATRTATFSYRFFKYIVDLPKLAPIAAKIGQGVASHPTIFNTIKIASQVTAITTGFVWGAIKISDAIYKKIYDDVPAFREFSNNFVSAVQWPETDNIELKSATLADSFVIGLNLT